ncbi:MAG TPA: DUF4886 domain-containing protein [Cyclobacteriaceae bacterium]|nr:DUF4886 domain-containing protein [Cyclobacteriaceae bacterium]
MRLLTFILIALTTVLFGQWSPTPVKPVKVLFIGNSYIYYNDMPAMLAEMTASYQHYIQSESETPGGYSLKHQVSDGNALKKIQKGYWNFVVIQEQSEAPAAPIADVKANTFPFAKYLDSVVHVYNKNSKSIFYMTWGRKNGSTNFCNKWPDVCTYEGMDNLLAQRYTSMAKDNHAVLAPVGAVWKYIRKNYPKIELYDPDGSHPSEAGSYAAACTFATIIFKKDPTQIKFDSKLSAEDARNIRNATKKVVFDRMGDWYY